MAVFLWQWTKSDHKGLNWGENILAIITKQFREYLTSDTVLLSVQ